MKVLRSVALSAIILMLPGCGGNIFDWGKEAFKQGENYDTSKRQVVNDYIRSLRMYDEFTTLGIFDVMWLSDEVRTVYAQVYATMLGKDEDAEKTFLRRQLKANEHYISFYVLSTSYVPLTIKPTQWAVYLELDGKKYLPFEVKAVELPVEYITFFGSRMTRHKHPYEVRFDRKDSNGNDLLSPEKPHAMKMFFSNPKHYGSINWDIREQGVVRYKRRGHLYDAAPGVYQAPCHVKKDKKEENKKDQDNAQQEKKNS